MAGQDEVREINSIVLQCIKGYTAKLKRIMFLNLKQAIVAFDGVISAADDH